MMELKPKLKPRAAWGADGWVESSGFTLAYIADSETAEYLGANDVWVSEGTGLPAGAYLDEPPAKEDGKAIIRSNDDWAQVDDLRGQTAYNTATGQPIEITDIGPLADGLTLVAPSSQFDRWNEHAQAWELDKEAEQQAKLATAQTEQSTRISTANQQIAIIKPAVDGGYAKPDHTQLLADWQRCRYELTLVPEKPGWPESPQWPAEPDKVI